MPKPNQTVTVRWGSVLPVANMLVMLFWESLAFDLFSGLGMKIHCQCDPDYIEIQFIIVGSDAEPEAQCVVCGVVLSHDSFFPFF